MNNPVVTTAGNAICHVAIGPQTAPAIMLNARHAPIVNAPKPATRFAHPLYNQTIPANTTPTTITLVCPVTPYAVKPATFNPTAAHPTPERITAPDGTGRSGRSTRSSAAS